MDDNTITIRRVANGWILAADGKYEVVAQERPELMARVMEWASEHMHIRSVTASPDVNDDLPFHVGGSASVGNANLPQREMTAHSDTNGADRGTSRTLSEKLGKKPRKPRISKAQAQAERDAGLRPPLASKRSANASY